MPAEQFRVFLASPGDVAAERQAARDEAQRLNDTHGQTPGAEYRIEVLCWETHCRPDAGRPQAVILDQVGAFDMFIGVMWKRFGSPTGVAESGTEEEYDTAMDRFRRGKTLGVSFYFRETPYLLHEAPWFSHCVSSAIRRLGRNLPPGRQLSAADVFYEIARHGTGDSVAILRKHRIGPRELEEIAGSLDLDLVTTEGAGDCPPEGVLPG